MLKMLVVIICWCGYMQATAQPNIVKAEYYIDTDPGFGSAINIPVSAVINVADQTFPVSLATVPVGLHAIFIRSKNASGIWSLTNPLFFYRQTATGATPNITKAEYYFDNDPGFGLANNIPLAAGTDIQDINFDGAISSLPVGIHVLSVRSRDINSQWSVTNQLVFFKKTAITVAPNITKAEYYFDNDPGFGLANNIPVTAGADIQDINFDAAIGALSVGIHILSVRSRDAIGKWSVTNQLVYFKKDPTITAPNITKAEYYVDNDPGFGYATNIPVTAGVDLQDVSFAPGLQFLTTGLHILNLRSCNAQGKWSVNNQLLFYKQPPAPGGITAIEYFYDSEPGFGQGIPVAINEINNLADYLVPVNITGLTVGPHNMYIRSRSSNGWSITNILPFDVNTTAATPFININSITNKENCTWNQFRISFHATGNYLPNNKFTVQLSDSSGAFGAPINIGQVTAQQSSIVSCQLPAHLSSSGSYRLRVISSNTAVTGVASLDSVNIHDRPELGNDTTVFIVCANETLNLLPLYNTTGLVSNWSIVTPSQAGSGNHQLIVTNIYGCRDSAIATVRQDVSFWTGVVSTNWHLAANWSTLKIPTEKTHIIVPGSAVRSCEITDGNGFAASVQVKNGGVITLRINHTLLVTANCNPLPTGL
ncbi:MAG: hypothetical protein V4722_12355 [Bacteroidota bacterium]